MSITNFDELMVHVGHNLECVTYGLPRRPEANVAVECVACSVVLLDFDNPAPAAPEEEVTFTWSTRAGRCYDCGRPAAFLRGTYLRQPHDSDETTKLCAVCAANAAADGEPITRIDFARFNAPVNSVAQEET